ncbi:hypothetical protein Tco_0450306 [Tanacetum coccineum]
MASGGSDRDAKDALSKLLQMGTVAEYESEFLMLINRVTGISESLLKSFYISGLKPTLQCLLLRSNPTTLLETFSLARATKARFAEDALSKLLQMGTVAEYQNDFEMLIKRLTGISEFLLKSFYISGLKTALQIKLLRERPTTFVEAFSLARMTEACFEDEQTTTTIVEITSDNDARDKASEVKMKVLVDGKQDDAKVVKVVVWPLSKTMTCQMCWKDKVVSKEWTVLRQCCRKTDVLEWPKREKSKPSQHTLEVVPYPDTICKGRIIKFIFPSP